MEESGRRKILLVEDEAIIARTESMALERNGYAVRAARTGPEAIEAVEREDFDLVLMDVDLGEGMDGTEAAARILALRSLPVLFLSGHAEPETVAMTERIASYGFVAKVGGEAALLSSIRTTLRLFDELSKKDRFDMALKESEAEFRSLFDAVPAGVVLLCDRVFKKVNAEMCEMFGYAESELLGASTRVLYFDDAEFERIGRDLYRTLRVRRRSMIETRMHKKDGTVLDILIGAAVIDPRAPDPMSSICGVLLDVTSRRRTQDSLRSKERLMAELFRACPECISLTTFEEGRFLEVNDAASRLLGYPREEIVGRSVSELGLWSSFEDRSAIVERLKAGELVSNQEARLRRKGGEEFAALVSMTAADIDGSTKIIGFVTDISERKRMEEALESSVREKEILLHELQHRIKNSLAMIAGMVELEIGRAGEGRMGTVLGNLKDRILSLSTLYEHLLKTVPSDRVDLGEYLRSLITSLAATYAGEGRPVRIEQRIDDMPIDMKRAVPWGLIVNELATNALKYAFPSGESGVIRIELARSEDCIQLMVSDDGVGLPEGFDLSASGGLGLDIVRMMADQLGGSLSLASGKGTTFVIRTRAAECE